VMDEQTLMLSAGMAKPQNTKEPSPPAIKLPISGPN
jgi:hypothetical protein